MSGPSPSPRDPGLQPERTRLAWRRATLSSTVTAVLAVKAAVHGAGGRTSAAGIVACALCCGLWLAFLLLAHRRIRSLAAVATPAPLAPRHATSVVLCTVATAACAVALVI
ncbi:DUF202 domain-containing protein [Streptomyces sp. NPDC021608]|uniref:DUF202 domain-containing protein n=1 Tax=Streptomyces sp. NPDC021608 TaxID=3154903 RepID=UPI0033EEA2C0